MKAANKNKIVRTFVMDVLSAIFAYTLISLNGRKVWGETAREIQYKETLKLKNT